MKNDFKFKKWRKKAKFPTIHLNKGDTLTVCRSYTDEPFIKAKIGRKMKINEARIFDALVDDRDSIGGLIIEEKNVVK